MAHKRAVFCAGGGALGAFEAGVLKRLEQDGITFDMAAGISTGGLQAVMVAQQKIRELVDIWLGIKDSGSIYTYWPGRFLLDAIGLVSGPYSTAPLRELLEKHVDPEAVRTGLRLYVGATNWRTGEIEYATNETEDIITWLMASAAFPPLFPAQRPKGKKDWYVDGGCRSMIPVYDLRKQEWDEGHIILARPTTDMLAEDAGRPHGVKSVGGRVLGIAFNEVLRGDLRDVHHETRRLYVYQPPTTADLPGSLDFDAESIARMIELGFEVGGHPLATNEWKNGV